MARATAAAMQGVNCNEDCSICDVIYDELDLSNSGSCSGGRRQLLLTRDDSKQRVHLKMDQRFTDKVNAVYEVVLSATDRALKGAEAARQ